MISLKQAPASDAAKEIVRNAMRHANYTYSDLSNRLAQDGCNISADSLRSKIARGTFSAAFMVEVLWVCDVSKIDLRRERK